MAKRAAGKNVVTYFLNLDPNWINKSINNINCTYTQNESQYNHIPIKNGNVPNVTTKNMETWDPQFLKVRECYSLL